MQSATHRAVPVTWSPVFSEVQQWGEEYKSVLISFSLALVCVNLDIHLPALFCLQGRDMTPCPAKTVGSNESVHVRKQRLLLSMYSAPYR